MKASPPPELPAERKSHNHGDLFRAKIVPFAGPAEYGEWFATEAEVRSAMRGVARDIGKRYYCETKVMTCAECERDQRPRVVCTL